MTSEHDAPLHAPAKPVKRVIEPAAPESDTLVPGANDALHVIAVPPFIAHVTPAGRETTVPCGGMPWQLESGCTSTVSE